MYISSGLFYSSVTIKIKFYVNSMLYINYAVINEILITLKQKLKARFIRRTNLIVKISRFSFVYINVVKKFRKLFVKNDDRKG